MGKIGGRILIAAVVLAVCFWFLYPTVRWYFATDADDRAVALSASSQIRDISQAKASADLASVKALAGDTLLPESFAYLKDLVKSKGVDTKNLTVGTLLGAATEQQVFEAIEKHYRSLYIGLKQTSRSALKLGLDLNGGMSILLDVDVESFEAKLGRKATEAEISRAIDEDIEVLKNRIDQYGVTEPEIRRQGQNQILIEISGEADPDRVESFLRGRGALCFQLVDTAATQKAVSYYSTHMDELYLPDGSIAQPDFLPEGTTLTGYYVKDEYGIDQFVGLCVIIDSPSIDGRYIQNAIQETDRIQNRPVVNFTLSSEGGSQMYSLTSEHVGDVMAVVLDGNVRTRATINSVLSTSIQISGFTLDEAQEIALLLKSATMPIEVSVASQRSVGASLGEDAVRIGLYSIIAGLALVVLFMFAYYGLCGLAADAGLLVMMYMIVSVMAGFKSTFTLSGIAGLILTLGMAVDSNVIIFERIKEQLRLGMTPANAVSDGFRQAFWTIMDANLTTLIAGVVLMILGSSTVKGFATTLVIGIVCSLFCSLFFCRVILDLTVRRRIHISFRRPAGEK